MSLDLPAMLDRVVARQWSVDDFHWAAPGADLMPVEQAKKLKPFALRPSPRSWRPRWPTNSTTVPVVAASSQQCAKATAPRRAKRRSVSSSRRPQR